MSSYQYILVEKEEGIATITLNRPEKFNALNVPMVSELEQSIGECAVDPETRVVIITGSGNAFCPGGDIEEFDRNPARAPHVCYEITKHLNRIIIELRRMPQPVIASINGGIGGAGISIAAACDIRIASSEARFRQGYTGVGLVPDGAWTLTIPLLIGWGRACELIFLNPLFGADKALEWGLVDRVVYPEELPQATMDLARQLARGPAQAFAIVKRNLNRALLIELESLLEEDRRGLVAAAQTDDAKEGFRAFLEKRKPVFKDRPRFW